ncbi:glycoside hydrolase family 127 protein [Demequina aurantiaca]|uniref:glycoside hydrolase family 127 protein n=1 Tax=Demequina aurantiaca TaxID=676200 RepID=UPI0007846859|nr:beta-L-arabinofuranosidase domain-containing protein [Demequina aurantiaca]
MLHPLGIEQVRIESGFWAEMQNLNSTAMIQHCEEWMERLGWIGNFDAVVDGRIVTERQGREFSDSDVYKLMEAMAWEIGRSGDGSLDSRFTALVGRIQPVQEADGYLNTRFGRAGQPPRYSDLEWGHELYCYGHLLQAAVARGRTRGLDDPFVDIARRAADHVCDTFGPDGILSVCGHAEVEVALVEFGRMTDQERYIDQAKLFVDRRGHGVLEDIEFGRAYYQDDEPIRDSVVLRGHSVRATYLAAGAIDLSIEQGDDELFSAVKQQMDATLARRTYITGGMGAHHEGESFGADFELPSDRAYAETCAGIGSMMTNYRLLLATGDMKYADVIERTLFNVLATSPAEDGRSFFYANTLHQREPGTVPAEDEVSARASSSMRAPWFAVSCCPTNVSRTVASLGAYVATSTADGVQVLQYAEGEIAAELSNGRVALRVETDYPNDGTIVVTVAKTIDHAWTIGLRVPAWAGESAILRVRGEEQRVQPGLVEVAGPFAVGEVIELELPLGVRVVRPDVRVDALRGQIAFERGPLVLCVESVDAPDVQKVDELRVAGAPMVDEYGVVRVPMISINTPERAWPYTDEISASPVGGASGVPLVPYFSWGNRGSSTMRVWIPTTDDVLGRA